MRRFFCTLLAALMCLSLLPLSALAEDEVVDVTQDAQIVDVFPAPDEEQPPEEIAEAGMEEDDSAPVTDGETYSGTCGENLTWTLDTDTGVLTISGTGAMTNYLREPDERDDPGQRHHYR